MGAVAWSFEVGEADSGEENMRRRVDYHFEGGGDFVRVEGVVEGFAHAGFLE
jgi:hypothetical protein